jgi:hypothetical protein
MINRGKDMFGKSLLLSLSMVAGWAFADGAPEQMTAVDAAAPQVLATVSEREFLYSIGLSEPGTLAVAHVRYRLEVQDVWHLAHQPGASLSVLTPGGCLALLRTGNAYLMSLARVQVDGEPQWTTSCDAVPEKDAAVAIARLNQQRQLQARAF